MRALAIACLLLTSAGCSVLFEPGQYTRGRDGSSAQDGGRDDAGMDAGAADAGDDASTTDAGTPNGWPQCGDRMRQSSVARDQSGEDVFFTDALYAAIFGAGASAASGEAAIQADRELMLPPPLTRQWVDVAIASRTGGAYIAVAALDGELLVYPITLFPPDAGDPIHATWADGDPPEFIQRIAMRSVGANTVLAVVGSTNERPDARVWICSVSADAVTCGTRYDAMCGITQAAVAVLSGRPEAVFFGPAGDSLRSDGVVRPGSFTLGERVSGTDGPIVYGFGESGGPLALVLGSTGAPIAYPIGPAPGRPGGLAQFESSQIHVRAINGGPPASMDLSARTLSCGVGSCRCTDEPGGSCSTVESFETIHADGLSARMIEVLPAGAAALAVVGAGHDATASSGTEVWVYAFDARDASAVDVAEERPGVLLGSGILPSIVGRMVDEVGLRAVVVPNGSSGIDLVTVALVDLTSGGGPAERHVFFSLARICHGI